MDVGAGKLEQLVVGAADHDASESKLWAAQATESRYGDSSCRPRADGGISDSATESFSYARHGGVGRAARDYELAEGVRRGPEEWVCHGADDAAEPEHLVESKSWLWDEQHRSAAWHNGCGREP